ncbi:MAG TPA: GNAT family N-acetyltransferase [Ktedonobacterales bacterium]
MVAHEALTLRGLRRADVAQARRILETSEYTHYRFAPDELPRLIDLYPGVGAFSGASGTLGRMLGGSLQAFVQVNEMAPPCAWIGGFGVTWSQGERYREYLALLLAPLREALLARAVAGLYYSGADYDTDWLREPLEALGFHLVSILRSYDKSDYSVPSEGNQDVRVRPFQPADAAPLAEMEKLCFDDLWRHDAQAFLEAARTYPYFVVAEDDKGIVGYQFNIVDMKIGYLVRIATHPRAWGTGVGTRLMAEAVRYFQRENAWKIVLNTEESNTRAHRLYEWFGFYLARPRGFALGLPLAPALPVSPARP